MSPHLCAPSASQARTAQVWACLGTVMDPELDEPVTELGFVTAVRLQGEAGDGGDEAGHEVQIDFRLPTYWCAANFAFLMADDMRRAVAALPWVRQVRVHLHDHMEAEAINQGVARGQGFQAAFGAAAEADLDGLRQTFLRKAFERRQEALLRHLIDAGHPAEVLVGLHTTSLPQLPLDAEGRRLVERHLARRPSAGESELAFVDTEGRALTATGLAEHLRAARRVGINAEFNSVLCRGLLAMRGRCEEAQPIHLVRRVEPRPR